MKEFEIEKVWPDWHTVRLLGEGSFGRVYEIVRNKFGIEEHCALKVITIPSSPAELQSMRNEGMDEASATAYYKGLVEEFVQEIALMSKLKGNANIVGYEDYAVLEHQNAVGWDIVIRMELLTSLPAYIQKRPFTVQDVIQLGMDLCDALEVCHRQHIIHRDIKPDNIFVSQSGTFKLGDFGVARTIEKTMSGLSKKGTYTYMAPEVYKGEAYGTNVDLYSLGIVLYKLLNHNREPFLPPYPAVIGYHDKNDALVRRLRGEPVPPPANGQGMLSQVVLKAVSFRGQDRYQLPSQLKADLQRAKTALETGDSPLLMAEHVAAAAGTFSMSHPGSTNGLGSTWSTSGTGSGRVFVFGADSRPPAAQTPQGQGKTADKNGKLEVAATIVGWSGAALWFLIFLQLSPFVWLFCVGVVACMTLLSIQKFRPYRTMWSWLLVLFSLSTANPLTLAAAILFLCTQRKR